MKISFFEENKSNFPVSEVNLQDELEVESYTTLINDGGQLSWTLTPSRLKSKLGSRGKLYGMVDDAGNAIGVIGIKEIVVGGISGGEIGYLYVSPDHRSLSNAVKLYHAAIDDARSFTFLMATTVTSNRQVNALLTRARKMEKIFTAQSPYSSNHLNYWLATENSGSFTFEEIKELFEEEYGDNIIQTGGSLNEAVTFKNVDRAPTTFQNILYNMARSNPLISIDKGKEDDVKLVFGRQDGLPEERNTVYAGNRFFSKSRQYKILKGIVPTINTFESSNEVDGEFIAKKDIGQRQDGQLINQRPENDEGYIFQPLLNIESEYRVIVYYMNGEYHVSGVYEKTGSNVSFRSITSGEIFKKSSDIAKTTAKALGYGLSGIDIALVEKSSHVNESVSLIGATASTLGRLAGKLSRAEVGSDHVLVVLEANTMPSMNNPMIAHETIKHMLSNKK